MLSASTGADLADIDFILSGRGGGCIGTAQLHASLPSRRFASTLRRLGGLRRPGGRLAGALMLSESAVVHFAVGGFVAHIAFCGQVGEGGGLYQYSPELIWLPEVGCTATARARAAANGTPNQAVSRKPGYLASGLRNRHNVIGGSVEQGSAIPFVCTYPVEHWDSILGIYLCTCCMFCTCVYLICWSRSGHSLLG